MMGSRLYKSENRRDCGSSYQVPEMVSCDPTSNNIQHTQSGKVQALACRARAPMAMKVERILNDCGG